LLIEAAVVASLDSDVVEGERTVMVLAKEKNDE